MKIEVEKILNRRKEELLELGINPHPEYIESKGNFKEGEQYEDPKSYYIKIYRTSGKRFAVIRISEHSNRKNPEPFPINTTFFDITGKSEEEVEQSFNECLQDLNDKIDHEKMIQEISKLS